MEQPKKPLPQGSTQPDYVVIDRNTLRQTLEAVINTLKSTINFELLQKNKAIDPKQQAELHQQLVNSRGALITGIKRMLETVETLPGINITQEDSEDKT